MNDRYHRAARDGHVTLLKEATRKELNCEDEDGLTPVLWAAQHGNLEALRVMLGRGGEPDKCDIWGNSPLHLAAANGHLDCLSFLVSFGADVWCLDNDYHTPLDAAAAQGHMDAVRYLDSVAAKQSVVDPKLVRKLKERAFRNAERRIKRCAQLQQEHQRRMEKKFFKEIVHAGASGSARFSSYRREKKPQFNTMASSVSYTQVTLNSTCKGRKKMLKCLDKNMPAEDTFKVSEDGRKSMRSLSGLQLGNDVMFLKQQSYAKPRRRLHVCNMFPSNPNDDDGGVNVDDGYDVAVVSHAVSDPGLYNDPGQDSLFSRPGLGTLVFRRNYDQDGADWFKVEGEESTERNIHFRERGRLCPPGLQKDVVASATCFQSQRFKDFRWNWDNGEDDDDEYDEEYDDPQPCSAPLEVFLVSQGLSEFLPLFLREQMDLEALTLCSEPNLAIINIPLGPRKKLLEACSRRTHTLQRARAMCDTQL